MMYSSGLLVVSKGLSQNYLSSLYGFAKSVVKDKLYVTVNGLRNPPVCISDWSKAISTCYKAAADTCPQLDIRLLLPSASSCLSDQSYKVVIVDNADFNDQTVSFILQGITSKQAKNIVFIEAHWSCSESIVPTMGQKEALEKPMENVCMGGTFDRLHLGHKILLSEGSVCTSRMLTVGVTQPHMLKSKILNELIEPLDVRIANVQDFLGDVRPGLHYHVIPLQDAFGPPIHDPNYSLIVGSPETLKGCNKVNEIRVQKGFKPLAVRLIDIVEDSFKASDIEENKISSSSIRMRLLGTLLRNPNVTHFSLHEELSPSQSDVSTGSPYILGLTGGMASGKSTLARKMADLGAGLIDCDKLGHMAYRPDTACFHQLVKTFGDEIVDVNSGEIDRKVLGSLVFSSPDKLTLLNGIVWPEILREAKKELALQFASGHRVVVLDAAVLLEAGWDTVCNEVWTTLVPTEEAIKRIGDRNGLSREQAEARLSRQLTNQERISKSHVVFCTLWDYAVTAQQLDRAWMDLMARLPHTHDKANL